MKHNKLIEKGEEVVDPVIDAVTDEPAANYAAEGEPAVEPVVDVAESAEEPVEEPPVGEPITEEPVIEEPAVEDPIVEEPAVEPTVEEPIIEEPAVDYVAEIATHTARISELETEVENLNSQLSAYRAAEVKAVAKAKADLVTSYSALLDKDELGVFGDNEHDLTQYSLEDIEAKLAVIYSRKQMKAAAENIETPAVNYQLNINAVEPQDPILPGFMLQALEIDKANELKL